jgi:hypothetical protein
MPLPVSASGISRAFTTMFGTAIFHRRRRWLPSKKGAGIDAVALTTKTGFLYLFERESGKPLYDIVEKPVPLPLI